MGFAQNSTFGFGSNGDVTGGTVSAANNGLSLAGGTTVVLGQDLGAPGNPAALISVREIPMGGFGIFFSDSSIAAGIGVVLASTTMSITGKIALGAAAGLAINDIDTFEQILIAIESTGPVIRSVGDAFIAFVSDDIGIGVDAPTANLHVKAGIAAIGGAPIKLNPGPLLPTPENGAFEFNGTHLFFDIGTTRFQMDQQVTANCGLTYSGSNVQLGQAVGAPGNPAILTSNREIPTAAFVVNLTATGGIVQIDTNNANIAVFNNTTIGSSILGGGVLELFGEGITTFASIIWTNNNTIFSTTFSQDGSGLRIESAIGAASYILDTGEVLIHTNTPNGSALQVNGSATLLRYMIASATDINIQASNSFTVFNNGGAGVPVTHFLPSAAAGLTYTDVVVNANGITITAAAGDTIRIGGSVTAAAGSISATAIGTSVTLVAIDATQWIAIAHELTWTF